MRKLFNKILVPVDFSKVSRELVNKAVDIAQEYECSIYLLHVVSDIPFSFVAMSQGHMAIPFGVIENRSELEYKMNKLLDQINLSAGKSVPVQYGITKGEWLSVIDDLVSHHKFDLILIGQKRKFVHKRKLLVDPDKLAETTNIPVITIPVNRRLTKLFAIVIPVTDFLPVNKLMYGIYMASLYNTTITLLGVENEKTKDKVQYYMQRAFKLIRDNCSIKVQAEIIVSQNVAEAVNEFAMLESADLVILNPGSQTRMPGFFSSLFRNIIQRYTAPPVLTISPL
ncbi:MAG: universal stress protein [Ferruginibacter sp.]